MGRILSKSTFSGTCPEAVACQNRAAVMKSGIFYAILNSASLSIVLMPFNQGRQLPTQRFGAWRSGGFRSTKLSIHHKS